MTLSDFQTRSTCRLCDRTRLEQILELTPTPPGNRVLSESELATPAAVYPLELRFCSDCFHVQLGHVVDPRILYQNHYSYVTGTSPVFVRYFETYASDAIARFGLAAGDLVADIGSNDGTCLRFFRDAGMRVLGIDPATEIAETARAAGIDTLTEFFDLDVARRLRVERGPARLITSHNVCAHIDDLRSVIRGVEHWLADDGVFVFEVGYFLDVYQQCWFDTIYHEHLDFHTVQPLIGFFARDGMEVVSAERTAPQGGSIRITVQRAGAGRPVDGSAAALGRLEREAGLQDIGSLRRFGDRLEQAKRELTDLLAGIRRNGGSIAGYGAPTKSTTLMLHFGLGRDVLDFIVDDNPLKQGFFTPGTHIPIASSELIYTRKPDYLLILAWNFADSIMAKHARYEQAGGQFILPLPTARVASTRAQAT